MPSSRTLRHEEEDQRSRRCRFGPPQPKPAVIQICVRSIQHPPNVAIVVVQICKGVDNTQPTLLSPRTDLRRRRQNPQPRRRRRVDLRPTQPRGVDLREGEADLRWRLGEGPNRAPCGGRPEPMEMRRGGRRKTHGVAAI